MFENKYGKILTIILVVVVIIIIGLVGFLLFDLIKNTTNDADAADAVDHPPFGEHNKIKNTITNTENTVGDVQAPIIGDQPNGGASSNTENQATNKYKGYTWIGNIEIPKTGIKYPILNEVTPKSIEIAVAVLYPMDLQLLNQPGNVTIVGHNYRNSSFFSNNKNLSEGDKIYITDTTGNRVEYTITNKYITTAEDAEFMIRDTNGRREISLSTCTENVKNRLVIWASAD